MWTASRGVRAAVTALVVLAGACASVSSQWKEAEDRNTLEGYEAFFRANPDWRSAPGPRWRIAQLRWEGMRSSTDLDALAALEQQVKGIDAPTGNKLAGEVKKLAGEVRERRAVVTWAALRDGRDPAAVDAFLAEFPDTSVRGEAEARIEALAWEDVSRKPGPATWRSYLGRFPSGPHAADARAAGEGVCWQEARASGDEAKLRQHLALFPDGAHTADARAAIGEAVWRRAEAARTDLGPYREYLDLVPHGPRAEGAQDCTDWAQAEDEGTRSAVEQYLRRHPRGRFAERARQALPRLGAGLPPTVSEILRVAAGSLSSGLGAALEQFRASDDVRITGSASVEPDSMGLRWTGANAFGISRSNLRTPSQQPFTLTCSFTATFGRSGLRDLQFADEPRARLVTGGEAYVRVQGGWVPAIEPFFSKR